MKTLLFLLITIIPVFLFGQEMQVKIKIVDNLDQVDSVVIGKNYQATNGIDESFDESNLFETSYADLDIRSIQRSQENHECITESLSENTGNPLYFLQDIDSKVDIRSEDFFDPLANCFEIKFKATEYPVRLIIDMSDYPGDPSRIYWAGIFDTQCNLIQEVNLTLIDTIEISSESDIERLIFKKDHETGIKDYTSKSDIKIFPNPISKGEDLQIEGIGLEELVFELYSISGEKLMQKGIDRNGTIRFDNVEISCGIYFYKVSDKQVVLKSGKIILE